MKKNFEKSLKNSNGITLIVLVVTIIVLLILAGITVASLTGEYGLLNKSTTAKEETEKNQFKEELKLAVMRSYKKNNIIELELLTNNLSKIEGVTDKNGNPINTSNPVNKLPFKVKKNNEYSYKITSEGEVEIVKDVIIAEGLTIGSNVTYEHPGNTYKWEAKYASSDLEADGTADTDLYSGIDGNSRVTSWRVFKIDEDEGIVQIVPMTTPGKVRLQGAQGYNNGVQLLNEACSCLYEYSPKGITAKNLSMDDIYPLFKESEIQQFTENNYTLNRSYSYFPRIYEEEIDSVINGNRKLNGIKRSEPGTKLYSRTETTSLDSQTISNTATDGYLQANTSISPYKTLEGYNTRK